MSALVDGTKLGLVFRNRVSTTQTPSELRTLKLEKGNRRCAKFFVP